jgi:hypothetical protein
MCYLRRYGGCGEPLGQHAFESTKEILLLAGREILPLRFC